MKRLDGPKTSAARLAVLIVAALALAACGQAGGNTGEEGVGQAQNGQAQNEGETPVPEQKETPQAGTGDAAAEDGLQAQDFERNWRIGDGGEVGVRLKEGRLDLLDARPNDGWNVDVDERSGDEVKVDFTRGNEAWGFDAELDDGALEVRIRQELRDADAGTYRLGDAGAVEIRHEGESITLIQTRTTGGWSEQVQRDDDEVEVRFDRQDERWEFEAQVDDGRLEVHIIRKVNEPVRG